MISIIKNNNSYQFCIGKDNYEMTKKEIEKISQIDELFSWKADNWSLKKCDCIWCTEYHRDHIYLLTFKIKKWHVSEKEILQIIKDCQNLLK